MVDWDELRDAYGPAGEIPRLLDEAPGRGDQEFWQELWGRLCHQGSVYSGSFAAIPALTSIALHAEPAGYVDALGLAASIISSTDRPPGFDDVRTTYAAEIQELRDLAEANLSLADDSTDFVYSLQTLIGLENTPVWQNELHALADGELPVECPTCAEYLYIGLGEPDFAARVDTAAQPAPPTPIEPARPSDLTAGTDRMYRLAISNEQPEVAKRMLYMFGRVPCPACGERFTIPEALGSR